MQELRAMIRESETMFDLESWIDDTEDRLILTIIFHRACAENEMRIVKYMHETFDLGMKRANWGFLIAATTLDPVLYYIQQYPGYVHRTTLALAIRNGNPKIVNFVLDYLENLSELNDDQIRTAIRNTNDIRIPTLLASRYGVWRMMKMITRDALRAIRYRIYRNLHICTVVGISICVPFIVSLYYKSTQKSST